MTGPLSRATPQAASVFAEQLRAVGLALRGAVRIVGAGVGAVTVFLVGPALVQGWKLSVDPHVSLFVALLALPVPFLVWRGEFRARSSYLAALPVARARHVLYKVAAGWVWLMVLVGALLLWFLVSARLTGGSLGVIEPVALASDLPPDFAPEDAAAVAGTWVAPWWLWNTWFTASTLAYLTATIVTLASSRARRWLAGCAVGGVMLSVLAAEGVVAVGRVGVWLSAVFEGRYGLQTVLMGNNYQGRMLATPAGGEVNVWATAPDLEQWALATLLWLALATAGLLPVVVYGHRS